MVGEDIFSRIVEGCSCRAVQSHLFCEPKGQIFPVTGPWPKIKMKKSNPHARGEINCKTIMASPELRYANKFCLTTQ
jgi:hypothetical protein